MKRIVGIFCAMNLTGCVVANMDSSNYTSVPYVKTFQKKGALGHTDTIQRKNDLYSCGLSKKINPEQWVRNYTPPGISESEHDKQVAKIESCMERKGYTLLSFSQCGPLKAPTGLCN